MTLFYWEKLMYQPTLRKLTASGEEVQAEEPAPRTVNSVDATVGLPILVRVMARKEELETLLAALPAEELTTRDDIAFALSTIDALLTGDAENVPAVVAADMNRWLERNKHLAERANT